MVAEARCELEDEPMNQRLFSPRQIWLASLCLLLALFYEQSAHELELRTKQRLH